MHRNQKLVSWMPAKACARLCLRALRALWMEGETERLERRVERLRVHVGAGFEAEDTEVDVGAATFTMPVWEAEELALLSVGVAETSVDDEDVSVVASAVEVAA